jgi:hypothetical protein
MTNGHVDFHEVMCVECLFVCLLSVSVQASASLQMDCDSYALVLVFESYMRKTRAKSAKIPVEIADWLTAGANSQDSMQEHCSPPLAIGTDGLVQSNFRRGQLQKLGTFYVRQVNAYGHMPSRGVLIEFSNKLSINLVVAADVLEDRPVFGGELKHDPDIVFDAETPILL